MKHKHTIYSYTIESHPDKDAVYEWVRSNWHDLGDFGLSDSIESLKGFCNHYDLELDYSISIVPDRSEHIYISFKNDDVNELRGVRLYKYLVNNYSLDEDCPFTGFVHDEVLLDDIREFMKKPYDISFQDLIENCTHKLLKAIHDEGEYIYSDEGLKEMCEANEYEFNEDGSIYFLRAKQ